jgi:O-methyltransferase
VPALEKPRLIGGLRKLVPHAFHRRGALDRSFRRIRTEKVRGDYFEFGVYRGSTLAYAERLARRHLLPSSMRLFGFDSFRGLPSPTGVEGATGEFLEGDFACALPEVRENLDRRGVDWSRVHLVEGWFDETLNDELKAKLRPAPVAVALIDCDLYRSARSALEFLGDLLQQGSILLFDDWDCFGGRDHMGERRAFAEFLQASTRFDAEPWIRFGRRGQGFVIHIEPH